MNNTLQKIILFGLATLLLAVTVLTWGSIGSIVTGFCLVIMTAELLYQRFLTNNESNDYDMEQ